MSFCEIATPVIRSNHGKTQSSFICNISRIFSVLTLALLIISSCVLETYAENWSDVKSQIAADINKKNCADAWRETWKFAAENNIDAKAMASRFIVNELIMPNSLAEIAHRDMRLFRVVYGEIILHGALAGDMYSIDVAPEILRERDIPILLQANFLECVGTHPRSKICAVNALKNGIVKPYSFTVGKLNARLSSPSQSAAVCWEKPKPDATNTGINQLLRLK